MRTANSELLAAIVAGVFVAALSFACCKLGYDQGRNDGFKSGWREAMQAKELPETSARDVKHGI
jgi:hypothetical protein